MDDRGTGGETIDSKRGAEKDLEEDWELRGWSESKDLSGIFL